LVRKSKEFPVLKRVCFSGKAYSKQKKEKIPSGDIRRYYENN